jgi:O-antigen/teichoic acid export membrane protein
VYGPAWQQAAIILPWLGLLAALRILFELVYDYFVVLGSTRVVFSVQVAWLIALAPALYLGARFAGPAGAGAAQFAVGLLVVAPVYLYELGRTGLTPASLGARVMLPLAAAVAVAATAALAGWALPVDLLALGVAGLVAVGAVALLVYRMRDTFRSLRTVQATG